MRAMNVVVTVVALLGVYAHADYEFRMKNLGCDYTIESVLQSSASKNITNVLTTVHGNYRKVSTSTVLDNGEKYLTETIMRPDLASQPGYALEITYSSGVGTKISENAIQPSGGVTVYKNRELTSFNGHKCFKYFNVPGNAIYADSDGFIWGSEETNDDGEVSTITYKSYDSTAILAGQFTLDSDVISTRSDNIHVSPDATAYGKECRDARENIYIFELPDFGCDVKVMTETDVFTDNGDTVTTQTTITAHGTFMLESFTSTETWQTSSVVLVRPDQGSNKNSAAAYAFDYTTGTCVKSEIQLQNVDFAVNHNVFTHRDEEFYNGFVCYKYYNDSTTVYYVEKFNNLPRAIIIEGESVTRFVYYDFASINSTKFTFTGAELQACGSASGEPIKLIEYNEACNPIPTQESSSHTSATSSNNAHESESKQSIMSGVKSSSASIATMAPVMMIMVLIALIA